MRDASPEDASATTATADALVDLRDITKVYQVGPQDVRALAGLTVAFERGSFWALMGPSGSGKSTLLNLLGCLDRPTTGTYLLDGTDVGALDDDARSALRLRYLGFIFQSFNLIPQLTVQENIELPLFYLGWDEARSAERARDLGEQVGLGDRLGHRPSELSGGQQQRVAVARALANDPDILLADEPTGNLDTATGDQIMSLLGDLHARGKTILMVTHESEIAAHADARLHMRDGVVERIERNGD
jgi:putative ABC transport system ATP-binding protein